MLTHLLGFDGVRNYDGSWTEWGSAVRVPIVVGSEPAHGARALARRHLYDHSPPAGLSEIRDDFLALEQRDRLQLLLEFSNELPALPPQYEEHPDLLERVLECQSPVFIFVEVMTTAPCTCTPLLRPRSPTTRGFASILAQGLTGLSAAEVLGIPDDYPLDLGLTQAVSPLRMRGMVAMLGRVKRQVRESASPG